MKFTDIEILEAIKNGRSKDVLNYLYKTIQPQVKSWILRNRGSEDDAEDIFQDAVIAFHNYVIDDKNKSVNNVTWFIFSISKNLWINRVKQKDKFAGNIEDHQNIIIEENNFLVETMSKEKETKILEILTQLGPTCKDVLIYKLYYKLSMEEISEKMGFNNADTTKTKHYKCKQRLIKMVKGNAYLIEFLHT